MVRINWADPSLSGGLFEKIVGCLIGIEHPRSVRVRPAQGDGGVDIFDPVGTAEVDVFQAKYYPNQLQWTKIAASLEPLSSGGRWLDRRVRNWYLVVPKQPTPNDITKLDELAESVPFHLAWFAEDRLVALAAAHPEVGDYYLGDGRAQLKRVIQDWETCLHRLGSGESPRIEDVQDRLAEIRAALGRHDPHFQYGIEVHPASHGDALFARPGAIGVSSVLIGDSIVMCHVYTRYRGADEDAKDRLQLRFALTAEAAGRLADAIAVGGAPVLLQPTDIVRYELPSVGHQAPPAVEFQARITPEHDTAPAHLRLVVTSPDGDQTVARLTRLSISQGTEGATSVWSSPHGCFELTLVVNVIRQEVHLSIRRCTDLAGPIAGVAGDINLMRALQPGAEIAIALDRGPVEPTSITVVLDDSFVDPRAVAMLDALRVIQDHTRTIVTIPAEITGTQLVELVDTAALLEGLPTTGDMRTRRFTVTTDKAALGPGGPQDVFGDHFALGVVLCVGTELPLPHQTIELPVELLMVRMFRTARVGAIEDTDGDRAKVTLEPGAVPIWIDQRVNSRDEFTEELHQTMLGHVTPISTDYLADQLSRRGVAPSL